MAEIDSQFGYKLRELDNLALDLLLEDTDKPVKKVAYEVPVESFSDVLGTGVAGLLSDYIDDQGQRYFDSEPDQILLILDKVKRGDQSINHYELRVEFGAGVEGNTSLRVYLETDNPKVTSSIFDRGDHLDIGYAGHNVLTYDATEEDLEDFLKLFNEYSDESCKLTPPPHPLYGHAKPFLKATPEKSFC